MRTPAGAAGPRGGYSNRSACTGCRREARRAGRMLAATAISTAPNATSTTVEGSTRVGISGK